MCRKETVLATCDICGKQESIEAERQLISYPIKGWYFERNLFWNDNYSTALDFCEECFQASFGCTTPMDARKKVCCSIWKRFFNKGVQGG